MIRFLSIFRHGLILSLLSSLGGAAFTGCAMVQQKDREFLSDPIMQRTPDAMGSGMEGHNLPRREGSSGGSSGSGGGCGC
ncbi:MAG: DUF4266 domain-containing protein [Fibrobacterota bacterium]|nr:DUF4266 domain-containing protein [Fibrobacterota bacterium]